MSKASTVRKRTKITETKEQAGLELHIRVTAYDSGMVVVDGHPTSVGPDGQWSAHAATLLVESLREFADRVTERRASKGGLDLEEAFDRARREVEAGRQR